MRRASPSEPARALVRYALAWLWFLPPLALHPLLGLAVPQTLAVFAVWIALWAAAVWLDPARQFLHDRIAGTRIVAVQPQAEPTRGAAQVVSRRARTFRACEVGSTRAAPFTRPVIRTSRDCHGSVTAAWRNALTATRRASQWHPNRPRPSDCASPKPSTDAARVPPERPARARRRPTPEHLDGHETAHDPDPERHAAPLPHHLALRHPPRLGRLPGAVSARFPAASTSRNTCTWSATSSTAGSFAKAGSGRRRTTTSCRRSCARRAKARRSSTSPAITMKPRASSATSRSATSTCAARRSTRRSPASACGSCTAISSTASSSTRSGSPISATRSTR